MLPSSQEMEGGSVSLLGWVHCQWTSRAHCKKKTLIGAEKHQLSLEAGEKWQLAKNSSLLFFSSDQT